MGVNITDLLFKVIVFFTYSATCLLGIFFTFSIDLYRQIEKKANLEIFSNPIISPLFESNINWLDVWMEENHKIIGPILVFFSIIDMYLLLKFINSV
jgi:hypothetical protein